MKIRALFMLLTVAAVGIAVANDNNPAQTLKIGQKISLTLKDGTVKAGTIVKIDPVGVSLLTDDGGGKVLFDTMTDAEKALFGYDQKVHDAYLASQAAQQAQAIARAKANRQWEIDESKREVAAQAQHDTGLARYNSQFYFHGTVFQIVDDSSKPGILAYRNGTPDLYFIENYPSSGLHPNDPICVRVIRDGDYTYTTLVGGDQRTVAHMDIVPEEFFINGLADPDASAKSHLGIDDVQ